MDSEGDLGVKIWEIIEKTGNNKKVIDQIKQVILKENSSTVVISSPHRVVIEDQPENVVTEKHE